MDDRTLALDGKGSLTAAYLLAALAVLFGGMLTAVAALPETHHDWLAVLIGLAAFGGFGSWARREHARNRGVRRLTIATESLRIEHPEPLREPLRLPRNLIRAIAIDAGRDPRKRLPVVREFSWATPTTRPDGVEGYLWTAGDGDTLLPVLGAPKDRPNVAIVFHRPVVLDAARAARARGADARTGRTTLDRETPVIGVMLAVADPAAAAAALADAPELVPTLTTDHFHPARPAPAAPASERDGAAASGPAAAGDTPAAPAPPRPPLVSVPPPAPRPDRAELDLPRGRDGVATRRIALLVALAFAIPFAAVSLGLLALSVWMLAGGHVAWCLVPAGLGAGMLAAVLRREPDPPGGIATAAPALHAFIADVAREVGTTPPAEVRIALGPHDHVRARREGGDLLQLGLTTLAACDRDGLRALVAHELAHQRLRHTATSAIAGRTFEAVEALDRHLGELRRGTHLLALPAGPLRAAVRRYWAFAEPVVVDLKRRHEVAADELAATVAGPAAASAMLERTLAAGVAFDPWIDEVLLPALEAGHRPPLAASFTAYLERPEVRRHTDAAVAAARHELTLAPGQTHPPLGARLAIARDAGARASATRAADRRPAIDLLDRLDLLEQQLLAELAGPDRVAALQPVQAAA